jgi:hypothetical protein
LRQHMHHSKNFQSFRITGEDIGCPARLGWRVLHSQKGRLLDRPYLGPEATKAPSRVTSRKAIMNLGLLAAGGFKRF